MERTISGWHQDEHGDWVAELSCLHGQHVRHQPPFFDRPWTQSPEGRAARVGSPIDCPLCDRAELPSGVRVVRTAGPWDEATIPPALRREHRVGDRTWGVLRVLEGELVLRMLGAEHHLVAGDEQPIPPLVPHEVAISEHAVLVVDFATSA